MASNKFCPALVDGKPMLLPTHDFLAQIVAPKRWGPHLKEGTYHSPVLIQL